MRLLALSALAASFTVALSATASAQDFCVAKPGCAGTQITAAQLKARLLAAQSNGTADRFLLGAGDFADGPYAYSSAEPVEIVGSGGGTVLRSAIVDRTVLTVAGGTASAVSDLHVELSTNAAFGLLLDGAAGRRVSVTQTLGVQSGAGAMLRNGGSLADATVTLYGDGGVAVGSDAGQTTVAGSSLTAPGTAVMLAGAGGTRMTVTRSTLAAPMGAAAFAGTLTIADTLVDARSGTRGLSAGLVAVAQTREPARVDAERVTIVGSSAVGPSTVGVYTVASNRSSSTLSIRDSAISEVGIPFYRSADLGTTATIAASWVAHGAALIQSGFDTGPGALSDLHPLPAPTGFADAAGGDFRLRADSPLVDAGDPAGSAGGPGTDRDGAPRLADGDGDCVARHDVGAYEYQRPAPRAVATASAANVTTGTGVGFSAAGSCDPLPGTALSYAWRFDDGATAAGPEVSHAFGSAGQHTAVVTVTGSAGHAAEATAAVTVAAPARAVDRRAPAITRLRLPKAFTRGSALPRLGAGRRQAAIAFRLSERATVRLQFARRGRNGRYRAVATTVRISGRAGDNRLRFAARLSRRARLAPGLHRVTLVAVDRAGNRSRPVVAGFRVKG